MPSLAPPPRAPELRAALAELAETDEADPEHVNENETRGGRVSWRSRSSGLTSLLRSMGEHGQPFGCSHSPTVQLESCFAPFHSLLDNFFGGAHSLTL